MHAYVPSYCRNDDHVKPMAQKKILIVDDSMSVRSHMRKVLVAADFSVSEAANGKRGLEMACRETFDLLIVDVNMPVMNGVEMIAEIRRVDDYVSTPILVLTTESSMKVMKKGQAAGATAWMVKPFKPQLFVQSVEKLTSMALTQAGGS